MKSLQSIQKTFRVFQILAKIAMILSFILASAQSFCRWWHPSWQRLCVKPLVICRVQAVTGVT